MCASDQFRPFAIVSGSPDNVVVYPMIIPSPGFPINSPWYLKPFFLEPLFGDHSMLICSACEKWQ